MTTYLSLLHEIFLYYDYFYIMTSLTTI